MVADRSVQAEAQPALNVEGIWGRSYRLLTIGLTLTVASGAFEALAVATTMPATIEDLGGLALYGWAFSAFMLANLIGSTIAGSEADRHGPARPFVAGVGLFTFGLLVAGLASTMLMVIAGRAVQGLGAGVLSSVAYVAISRGYPESARPRMLAVLSSAWVIPGLIGPALAGAIADTLGWRWVFLGLAPLPLIGVAMALPALRPLSLQSTAPRDWPRIRSAVRLALGVGLLVAGLGATTLPIGLVLVCAGVVLGLPPLRRLLPQGTLRAAAGLPAAVATNGLLNMAFFGADAFVPLALTSVRGQTTTQAGLTLTAATVLWTTGAWIQAHFASRQSRRRIVMLGLTFVTTGIAGVGLALLPGVPVLVAPLAWATAGLGMGLAFSTISLVVLETAPSGQEGGATAAMQLSNTLGVALGTGIGGVIIAYFGAGAANPGAGIAIQDLLMVAVGGLAGLAAIRLPSEAPVAR